jgi:type IV pilus modification protein PilV
MKILGSDKSNSLKVDILIHLSDDRRLKSSGSGFSLIEVMIALVVLLVGMLGVMSMQYYAVGGNKSSRELRVATNMSGDLIEVMKSTDYASIAASTDTPLAVGETSLSGGVNFTRSWWVVANCASLNANGNTCTGAVAPTCATIPDGAFPVNASSIRARTCWVDKNGVNHSVTFDTVRVLEN